MNNQGRTVGFRIVELLLISKVFSRYLHSPGSHQSSRFNSLTDSVSHIGSIASHDAKNVAQQ